MSLPTLTPNSRPQTAQLTLKLTELAPQQFCHGEYEVRFDVEIAGQRFERRFDSEFDLERGGILRVQVDPALQDIDIAIRAFQINSDDSETRIDLDPVLGDVEFTATYAIRSDRLIPAGNFPAVNENQRLLRLVQNETSDADGSIVIVEGQGRDRILDFENGVDVIGLAGDLTFDDLSIRQQGSNVLISLGDEALAVVKGVDAAQLTRQDFTTIDCTQLDGVDLPIAARS